MNDTFGSAFLRPPFLQAVSTVRHWAALVWIPTMNDHDGSCQNTGVGKGCCRCCRCRCGVHTQLLAALDSETLRVESMTACSSNITGLTQALEKRPRTPGRDADEPQSAPATPHGREQAVAVPSQILYPTPNRCQLTRERHTHSDTCTADKLIEKQMDRLIDNILVDR